MRSNSGLGLYLHIPFCASKCAYCDFVSYPGLERRHRAYVAALSSEIAAQKGRAVSSVYFGGGTPTLLPASDLAGLLDAVRERFEPVGDAEITVEANPDGADLEKLQELRLAGFNRLSLGVQSLDPAVLQTLGRRHGAGGALAAFAAARRAGFENVSIDLIYGVPAQSMESWETTLGAAIALDAEHISAYCLSLEEGTPLARRVAAGELEADEDLAAEMMRLTFRRLTEAGYEHYEISNFARSGRRCAHNVSCWRYEDYLGLGASAHSKLGARRSANTPDVDAYIDAVQGERGEAAVWSQELSPHDEASEATMLGLRMLEGVPRQRFDALWHAAGEDRGPSLLMLEERGLAECGENLRLTEEGLLFANEALSELL